jgi:hypothetical protein
MRLVKSIIAAFFLSLGSSAHAGDPCPIPVNIADLGSPDWRDNLALINALESRQIWVGISFETTDEGLSLTHVFEGSPAKGAGLLEGDLITAIGGLSALDAEAFSSLNIGETVWVTISRNAQKLTLPLTVGGADPVPLAIIQQLQRADCRASVLAPPNTGLQLAIMARLFTQSRGFRCEDAHVALQPLMEQNQSDTVYFVRGSRRLLLTMPYYGTICVSVAALDGENLNDVEISAVIERVISNYVRERHANP